MKIQTIGQIITKQIGNKALFMIGARNMYQTPNGINFGVGRNSKRINRVSITLNALDTYDIEYWYNAFSKKTGMHKSKLVSKDSGIYNDGLRESIERNTGMYTSL